MAITSTKRLVRHKFFKSDYQLTRMAGEKSLQGFTGKWSTDEHPRELFILSVSFSSCFSGVSVSKDFHPRCMCDQMNWWWKSRYFWEKMEGEGSIVSGDVRKQNFGRMNVWSGKDMESTIILFLSGTSRWLAMVVVGKVEVWPFHSFMLTNFSQFDIATFHDMWF